MREQISWENAYKLWEFGSCYFPKMLNKPVPVETVFVKYDQKGYFYGYDWLENEEAKERKQLIKEKPIEFLMFTKPSNKGTIQTAEMLVEARDNEEFAAIWIAATSWELRDKHISGIEPYATMLHWAARDFLKERYYLWHHAMKKLVPDIMIPFSVLESIECKSAEPVMGLIQMNTVMLKNTWCILRYSSLGDQALPEYHRGERLE